MVLILLRGGRAAYSGFFQLLTCGLAASSADLRPVLLMLEKLKEWVMLDIYLVVWRCLYQSAGLCLSAAGHRAFSVRLLVVLSILTMIHLNVEQLWERFYPQRPLLNVRTKDCARLSSWLPL